MNDHEVVERIIVENLQNEDVRKMTRLDLVAAILAYGEQVREAAAQKSDAVEALWVERARSAARADDLVGGLAQTTYERYAQIASEIAAAIRTNDQVAKPKGENHAG